MYTLLADLTLLVHLAFVAFVVGGQVLVLAGWAAGWTFTRSATLRFSHLAAIAVVVVQAWLGLACPLTVLESRLRERAGQSGYERGLVADWAHRILFYEAPAWVFTAIYSAFAALVVLTLVLYPPRGVRPPGTAPGRGASPGARP